MSHAPAEHYDRVTAAWRYLMGEELHYGVFRDPADPLPTATGELTRLMLEGMAAREGDRVLDVGCGTGAPACRLAEDLGVHVTGITTSEEGIAAARRRAQERGLGDRTAFELRDGMDNGFADAAFDRAWALESSHLMRRRDRLVSECARVLRPGGRFVLCDIIRRREIGLADVRALREPLTLLRDVFGDARMESLEVYAELFESAGLQVESSTDLTDATRPTFEAWRQNARDHAAEVNELIGSEARAQFSRSCDVLQGFWDDGTLGYGLIVGVAPDA